METNQRPVKKPRYVIDSDGKDYVLEKLYKFRVLLPNGASQDVEISDPPYEMSLKDFMKLVKHEYERSTTKIQSGTVSRMIDWGGQDLYFLDSHDQKIAEKLLFKNFRPRKWNILRLNDGFGEADTYENMWDLTPDTALLKELPEEYTFETALADLIDNSLQAIWFNEDKKLICVEISVDRISVFDNGPGMDDSEENSIANWGKMGASLHRSLRVKAIGIKPPYLMPFFGMYGYGGSIASMHLGRHALVSSKMRKSKKVFMLHLQRDALLRGSGSNKTWRTNGGLRDPSRFELQNSPNGSFTKVEIFHLKMRDFDVLQLQSKLKDIYFPYIQSDEVSKTGRTIMPIEFQINGINLAEIDGGEVAITNLNSCNGPDFAFQLRFRFNEEITSKGGPGSKSYQEANARLKCVYFPIVGGEENIDKILKGLKQEGYNTTENFDNFRRVSIRRLGRLIPDTRWLRLPFMEVKNWKADKAQTLKRCYLRVKCFIDTDAGFSPTPSKTDLAHYHPYTIALKNFGNKQHEKDKGLQIELFKDGRSLSLSQLEKLYQEWIFRMHGLYDEEIDSGEDQPVLVVCPHNKKSLGISSDVVRVHKAIQRKGKSWKSGQKIKVLKGACPGIYKSNIYATLEYFILGGFQGDSGGEARLVCRPQDIPDDSGCILEVDKGNARIDIRSSISLPISVIDSGKCQAMDIVVWKQNLEKQHQKTPGCIEVLSMEECQLLGVNEVLPFDDKVKVGYIPPEKIIAVLLPSYFNSIRGSKKLGQKDIVKGPFEMTLKIRYAPNGLHASNIYSERVKPSSDEMFHGLYVFPLRCKLSKHFQKAGVYTFLFSLVELKGVSCEKKVKVKALSEVSMWKLLKDKEIERCSIRLGSHFPTFSIGCFDMYGNHIAFSSVPNVSINIITDKGDLIHVAHQMKLDISSDDLTLSVKDLLIETNELDTIRPKYDIVLDICSHDQMFHVSIPCQVLPGALKNVKVHPSNFAENLFPRHIIKELTLEMFDKYGNHVEEGTEILLDVDGFSFQAKTFMKRKVDNLGYVDIGGLLQVAGGFGRNVSLSVLFGENVVFKKESQIEKRELRTSSKVPCKGIAGSQLENIIFQVVNSEGIVDASIHDDEERGQSHTLILKSEFFCLDDSVRYAFQHGQCLIRAITLPIREGKFSLLAAHSRYPELDSHLEVYVHAENIQSQTFDESLFGSCAFISPNLKNYDVQYPHSDGNDLFIPNLLTPKHIEKLISFIKNDHAELRDDMFNCGSCVVQQKEKLEELNLQRRALEEEIARLQAWMDCEISKDHFSSSEKDFIMEQIENKGGSAASVVYKLFKNSQCHKQLAEKILGVVALLGTVQTIEISRLLSKYLGEDQMLAVVCKSHSIAKSLEKYDQDGNINCSFGLHGLASKLELSVEGHYLVICLDDIRPYKGTLGRDPQRKLALPDPKLEDGKTPPGYLGHAVNMLHLDVDHLHTRTAAGNGLRETLYYRLFGELQVYETRDYMMRALPYITQGAISLDGGIMRQNGIVSLGYWEPSIRFPVEMREGDTKSSPHRMAVLERIKVNRSKLRKLSDLLNIEEKSYKKNMKKLAKKRGEYNKFLDEREPIIKALDYGTPDREEG